jgi:aryl-alcohol dehydrogenase-like predicted oxidoreductase
MELDDYIVETLMRDLVGHDRRPTSFLVFLWLTAEQERRRGVVEASYQEIAESVGISKSSAQAALGWLRRRKLVTVTRASATATPVYTVKAPWRMGAKGAR